MKPPIPIPELPVWAWAALGFGAVWLWVRRPSAAEVGQGIGGAAVKLADGLISGTVKGIGGVVGVPDTDQAKCEAALAANDGAAAGKYCPAGTLIQAIPQSFADWLKGLAVPPPKPGSHADYIKPAGKASPASGILPGELKCTAGGICDGTDLSGAKTLTLDPNGLNLGNFDTGAWVDQKNTPTVISIAGIRG